MPTAWRNPMIAQLGCLAIFSLAMFPDRSIAQPAAGVPAEAADAPADNWPLFTVLPARPIHIDALRIRQAKPALVALQQQISTTVNAGIRLSDHPEATIPSANLRRRTDTILSSQQVAAATNPTIPIAIEPLWCSVFDYDVLIVSAVNARTNEWLGGGHRAFARAQWDRNAQTRALAGMLGGVAAQLTRPLLAPPPPRDNVLSVAIAAGNQHSRRDEGSALCLNELLGIQLPATMKRVRASGGQSLTTLHRALKKRPPLARPNRTLIAHWLFDKTQARRLPVTLTLEHSWIESFLGKRFAKPAASSWQFSSQGGQIQFQVAPDLTQLLANEGQSLKTADWPQVAKVDRAWVYLDRGRAWGLKMRDRMIAEIDGERVTGHVVRFFGPEQGLSSPRGFPIREGAILYIRKGQKLTKPGVEFRFDPKSIPVDVKFN